MENKILDKIRVKLADYEKSVHDNSPPEARAAKYVDLCALLSPRVLHHFLQLDLQNRELESQLERQRQIVAKLKSKNMQNSVDSKT